MATVTLGATGRYPVGTLVSAYPQSNWLHHELPPRGAPKGAATASGTVAANGTLTITGLPDDARFFAHANVAGSDVYTQLTTLRKPAQVLGDVQVDGALDHNGATAGFFGAAPVARPAAYTQTYSTATRTHAAVTATAAATTAATQTSPFGYATAAQADAIRAAVNANITDIANVKQLLNQVIDDLQALGLLQ